MRGPSQLEDLFRRRQKGIRLSLDATRQLCAALGNPQEKLRFIHIAGTNGKGSVAAMAAAVLQQAGQRTGLYTSPHLCRYNERFRLDGRDITGKELEDSLSPILQASTQCTFFEISTALAFAWFNRRQADWVVLETGMGGRLDSTNIVAPSVSVITAIGMDHLQFLGDNLKTIAAEKAGIIKPGIPVITLPQEPEALEVLRQHAGKLQSPLKILTEKDAGEFSPPLAGDHQRWNTAAAVAACRKAVPSIDDATIRRGLLQTRWPGRCQLVETGTEKPPVLVDGAHNPQAAGALAHEILRRWGRGRITLILGILADKNMSEIGRILTPLASHTLLVPVASERAASPARLQTVIPSGQPAASLAAALHEAIPFGNPIVIAGSLFLTGEALQLLDADPSPHRHPNEQLNPH